MSWSLESIAPLQAVAADAATGAAAAPAPVSGGFARLMESQLSSVNTDVKAAESALGDLAAGRPVELHEVMISLERARISVQTFVQVRNKLVESYQDLMRMQM